MKKAAIDARRQEIEKLKAHTLEHKAWFQNILNEPELVRSGVTGKYPFVLPSTSPDEYVERAEVCHGRNAELVQHLVSESQKLPTSTGQRWYRKTRLKIGIIADGFLLKSFDGAVDFVLIDPDNWRDQLTAVDALLVTTAWRGIDGEWFGLSLPGSDLRKLVRDTIIPAAREAGLPVAFYSKEDPPNYELFLSLAQKSDYVLTSALEVLPNYQQDAPNASAYDVMPFGVSPLHHHPLGSMRFTDRIWTFAGSWHRHKYMTRRTAALKIFRAILARDEQLLIFDRNSALGKEKYQFPEFLLPHLYHSIDHSDLLTLQRMLPVAINLNSVQNSQTMFANRALELQGMGTQIISNLSDGINSQFPQVFMPDSEVDAEGWLATLTAEDVVRAQLEGIRAAYTDNTGFDRISALLKVIGFDDEARQMIPSHRVLVRTSDQARFERFVKSQTYAGELAFLAPGEESSTRASAHDDVVVDIQDRDYHPGLLQDLVNGFKFTDCDQVFAVPTDSQQTTSFEYLDSAPADAAATATWVPAGKYVEKPRVTSRVAVGNLPGPQRAAYSVPTAQMIPASHPQGSQAEITVVVPIYNNGGHLRHKCFASLRRSSIFDSMRVLLVDDGSTDIETQYTIQDLVDSYPNVDAYRFPPGGSGSASRPRNMGLELTTTPYITYLDPDNEALNDGYAQLLEKIKETGADFVIGDIMRIKGNRKRVNNANIIAKVIDEDDNFKVAPEALAKINFQPMSIQALVADTRWLKSLGIEQPLGAVGQDSYFFQQMLFYAQRAAHVYLPIHSYYAAVANSTVNSIAPRFFEKYIPLESARAAWLKEEGLMDEYRRTRLEPFFKNWYLVKLQRSSAADRPKCVELIKQLGSYYGPHEWQDPDLREFFKKPEPRKPRGTAKKKAAAAKKPPTGSSG